MDPSSFAEVIESERVTRSLDETADAVVVGSGCGGAVVARELARAGKRVVMVERGGLYLASRGDFDQREDDMLARIDGGRGLHGSSEGQLALTYGHNVGGASVHYWADTWRTPLDRLEQWERDFGVTGHSYHELLPFFERIEKDLNVHPAEDARLNTMNRLFQQGAEAAGIEVERVLQARKGCIGSGYCMQGCAFDAKQSQVVTTVPEALRLGVKLFADCEVDHLDLEGGRATGLTASFIDRRTQRSTGHALKVKAKVVIVAAGGFNSAPLLMRSKVPDPSGQLGRNLRVNPCPQVFGLFNQDVVMWRNIPAGVGAMGLRLHRFDDERYVEGGYLLYPNQLPPATLAALLPGFGTAHRALMERAHQIGSAIAWLDDRGSGSVTLDDEGLPRWHFELSGLDLLTARDAMKKEAEVLLRAGATEVLVPDAAGTRLSGLDQLALIDAVDVRPGSMLFAAPHPCGMTRMGKDPARSVVAPSHQLHAVKGLYVCDPSVFPTAPSVDPSETIMAFSHVAARSMLLQAGW